MYKEKAYYFLKKRKTIGELCQINLPKILLVELEQREKMEAGNGRNVDKRGGWGSLQGVKWDFTPRKAPLYSVQR